MLITMGYYDSYWDYILITKIDIANVYNPHNVWDFTTI